MAHRLGEIHREHEADTERAENRSQFRSLREVILQQLLGRIMGALSAPSEASKLVAALKPLLDPARAERLEKALRATRMVQAARTVLPELTLSGERR